MGKVIDKEIIKLQTKLKRFDDWVKEHPTLNTIASAKRVEYRNILMAAIERLETGS